MNNIRLLSLDDLPSVMEIINDAIKLLGKNSLQWQQGYPNIDTMKNDINNKVLYGYYDCNNYLVGVVALIKGKDENYVEIENGSWNLPANKDDLVIHRIAVRDGYHHLKVGNQLMKFAIEYAKSNNCQSIKIDTHAKNIPMQKLCINNGFIYKGIIYLKRDEIDNSRLAYELDL